MNNVAKEEGMRKETDQVHIHELIEERVVEDQRNELVKAIFCRCVQEKSSIPVTMVSNDH